jgi:hypothetical protein
VKSPQEWTGGRPIGGVSLCQDDSGSICAKGIVRGFLKKDFVYADVENLDFVFAYVGDFHVSVASETLL